MPVLQLSICEDRQFFFFFEGTRLQGDARGNAPLRDCSGDCQRAFAVAFARLAL
ncbi:MAG TPA: hypothetical protein VGX91_01505 [Candidatus Cybelea sp.]|nr:hypothetical protein [Candidatus Cybelea sp.]